MSFYKTKQWKAVRAVVVKGWRAAGSPPCPLCRLPITGRPFVDHIQSVKKRPDLALYIGNLRVVCTQCNTRRHKWEAEDIKPTSADGFSSDEWR